MEWIDRLSDDVTGDNIEALLSLFPDVATEVRGADGELHRAVDYDALREKLGDVAEGGRERYQFTWPGKREARAEASRRIDKVLRPCVEESKDWDTTQNLYIEGDNLDALKILRKNYAGKIKMIYIDPPYNTGNDFIYDDDFAAGCEEYKGQSGDFDERGRLVENRDTNGRFHSDWCSMMLPRLMLARDLLSDDGVIFISIDDHEFATLFSMCNEVFGINNNTACLLWEKTSTPGSLSNKTRKTTEYILVYEKIKNNNKYYGSLLDNCDAPLLKKKNKEKEIIFPKGSVKFTYIDDGLIQSGQTKNGYLFNNIEIVNGFNVNEFKMLCHTTWKQSTINEEIKSGTFFIVKTPDFAIRFQRPMDQDSYKAPNNRLDYLTDATNEFAQKELLDLSLDGMMTYPKPINLIKYLINMIMKQDLEGVILDFFSGSSTTAHAVMQINIEDAGIRKFIMVQIPEVCAKDSAAAQAGYTTIAEIGKERIRRAGAKIAAEVEAANAKLAPGETPKTVPDIGFRVLKIDSSNYDDVTITPGAANQAALAGWADNIKPDRTALDLLFSVFGDLSISYSASIETLPPNQFSGHEVFSVEDGTLVACFDTDLDNATIEAMAKLEPSYCVVRDASFEDDAASTNFEELFKTFSPSTRLRVL